MGTDTLSGALQGPHTPAAPLCFNHVGEGVASLPCLGNTKGALCFPPHRLSNHFKQKTRLTVRLRAAGGTLQRPGCPAPLLPLVAPEAQATGGPAAPAGSLSRKDGCTSDPCLPPTTAKGKDRRTTEPAGTGREESPGLPMAGPSSARHPAASGPSWRGKFTRSAPTAPLRPAPPTRSLASDQAELARALRPRLRSPPGSPAEPSPCASHPPPRAQGADAELETKRAARPLQYLGERRRGPAG